MELASCSSSNMNSSQAIPKSKSKSYIIETKELQNILEHGIACYRVQLSKLSLYELYCEYTCAFWEYPNVYDPTPMFHLINFNSEYLTLYAPYMIEQLVYYVQGRYFINPKIILKFEMPIPNDPLPIEDTLKLVKQGLMYVTEINN